MSKAMEFKKNIEQAISALPGGEERFHFTEYSQATLARMIFGAPDYVDQMLAEFSIEAGPLLVVQQYHQEVAAIESALSPPLTESRDVGQISERVSEKMARRNLAMNLWDRFGMHYRYSNGFVHVITSPTDLAGLPLVNSYPVQYFLTATVFGQDRAMAELHSALEKARFWRRAALSLFLFLGVGVLIWLSLTYG